MERVTELLERFHSIAASPEKQLEKYFKQGKQVIACAPVYTPEEIIHSMGLVPFGVWGADMELEKAKSYFPAFICSVTQSILELGMAGQYEGISAIVIPSLCDSLKCLGQNWKYAVPDIPFIPMTYPQNRNSEGGIAFAVAGYKRVIRDLEEITGKRFDEDSLVKSNNIYNTHNAVMREVSDLLGEHPSITAIQRSEIFRSAYFMTKEEHTSLVKEFIEQLIKSPEEKKNKIRVITSGILADNSSLLSVLDDNNIQIVGDDIAHESRQYRIDSKSGDSALDSLARKFSNMGNCSVLFDADKKRSEFITDMVKSKNASAVLMIMTKFCDPEEFDYVIIRKACEKANISCLQIEIDRQMVNYEQAKTMIQTFSENIQ